MIKNILTITQPESDDWAYEPSTRICGNRTLDALIQRIGHSLLTESDKPWDFYLWKSEGKRYDLNDSLVEECDRWHLSRYEVFSAPTESKYQAIVMLYYQPVVKVAIAV